MLVEVCANSLESALNAEKAGADRIELCAELGVGGITPSYGLLKSVREKIRIPVHVLIRPRSGDFTYTQTEFESMLNDISLCKEMGFSGVVSGILHQDFSIDVNRTKQLMDAAKGLKFIFHRAFDWVKNPEETFETLDTLGVDYLLSSGQKTTAEGGIDLLKTLLEKSKHCQLMPGGGITAKNAASFKVNGFKVIHLSGTKLRASLFEEPKISMNSTKFLEETKIAVSDEQILREVIKSVK